MGKSIAVLAGRRIDAEDAEVHRFPLARRGAVSDALKTLFEECPIVHLVCSAACGADLIALEIAAHLGIATSVVLPFDVAVFRKSSVIDRPGEWGTLFDEAIRRASAANRLKILNGYKDQDAYEAANTALIQNSLCLAEEVPDTDLLSVVVWDLAPRGPDDLTAHFKSLCSKAGFRVREISTL